MDIGQHWTDMSVHVKVTAIKPKYKYNGTERLEAIFHGQLSLSKGSVSRRVAATT